MNDMVTRDEAVPMARTLPAGANVGAITIESERAVAEARGQIQLAKMFPRDLDRAEAELMRSCKIVAFASVAFYSKPQGKDKDTGEEKYVTGESIRLAEEMARVVGNFEYGHRELSRSDSKSEIEVYAWDKEQNNRSIRQLTVMHWRDTKAGGYKLRDQKDIDDKISNVASKQVRGRILALMPKWLLESAKVQLRETLAADAAQNLSVRTPKLLAAFAKVNITEENLSKYINAPLDKITADHFVDLQGVYNAIRDGANPANYFDVKVPANDNQPAVIAPVTSQDGKPHPAAAAAAKRTAKAVAPSEGDPAKLDAARSATRSAAPAPAPAPQPTPTPTAAPEPEGEPPAPPAGDPAPKDGGDFF